MTSSADPAGRFPDDRPYGGVFDSMPGDPEVDHVISDGAFIRAVVRFEAAVMRSQAAHGVIPVEAADAIGEAATRLALDPCEIGHRAQQSATPIIAIVEGLRLAVGPSLAGMVHHGLTSQDCVDTAFSIMEGNALDIVGPRIATVIGRLSRVAEQHAATPMLARTLGQPAGPTTYGWKACRWIEALDLAATNLGRVRGMLAVQLGGPTGDIARMGPDPHALVADVAGQLELDAPRIPWHTERSRVLQLASACVQAINACAKVAADIAALASFEVGELMLGRDERQRGRGGSSAMPHKRNPAAAVLIRSAATSAPGLLGNLAAAGLQEHERSAGAWQSEWRNVRELLHLTGGVARELALLVADIDADPARMAANLNHANVPGSPADAERRALEYLRRFA